MSPEFPSESEKSARCPKLCLRSKFQMHQKHQRFSSIKHTPLLSSSSKRLFLIPWSEIKYVCVPSTSKHFLSSLLSFPLLSLYVFLLLLPDPHLPLVSSLCKLPSNSFTKFEGILSHCGPANSASSGCKQATISLSLLQTTNQ